MPEGVSTVGPPALSPDGRKLAFDAGEPSGRRQIWVRSLDQLEAQPMSGTKGALRPIWSPDSRFIAFVAGGKLRKVDVAGGPPQTICDAPNGADSWSPEGVILFDGRGPDPIWKYLLYASQGKETRWDLWALSMSGEKKPFPVAKTRFSEMFGGFSPDAKYVAYSTDESGQQEVYFQDFPEARDKWQVSTKRGTQPFWSGNGKEIFYRAPDARVMSVPVTIAGGFEAGVDQELHLRGPCWRTRGSKTPLGSWGNPRDLRLVCHSQSAGTP